MMVEVAAQVLRSCTGAGVEFACRTDLFDAWWGLDVLLAFDCAFRVHAAVTVRIHEVA